MSQTIQEITFSEKFKDEVKQCIEESKDLDWNYSEDEQDEVATEIIDHDILADKIINLVNKYI